MAGFIEALHKLSKLSMNASEELEFTKDQVNQEEQNEFFGLSKVMEQGPRIGTVAELKAIDALKNSNPIEARIKVLLMKLQKELG